MKVNPCDLFNALSNPDRLRILAYIERAKPQRVKEISSALDMTAVMTSRHLAALRACDLIHENHKYKGKRVTINTDYLHYENGILKSVNIK